MSVFRYDAVRRCTCRPSPARTSAGSLGRSVSTGRSSFSRSRSPLLTTLVQPAPRLPARLVPGAHDERLARRADVPGHRAADDRRDRAHLWLDRAARRRGHDQQFAHRGLGLVERPLQILNTELAVVVALVHILLPYMVFPLFSALAGQDPDLERAGQHPGGRPRPHLPRGDAAAQPARHPDGIGARLHARGGRGGDAGAARRQGRADDGQTIYELVISTLNWPLGLRRRASCWCSASSRSLLLYFRERVVAVRPDAGVAAAAVERRAPVAWRSAGRGRTGRLALGAAVTAIYVFLLAPDPHRRVHLVQPDRARTPFHRPASRCAGTASSSKRRASSTRSSFSLWLGARRAPSRRPRSASSRPTAIVRLLAAAAGSSASRWRCCRR